MKKAISLFLALVMAMSCMSLGAFAEGETTAVAKIGETGYDTLQAAITAANAGDTVLVVAEGTYAIPNPIDGVTIKGLEDNTKVIFDASQGTGNLANTSGKVTFKNVSFKFGGSNYTGFQHPGEITFDTCVLTGYFSSYGDMTFNSCTFNQSNEEYSMWVYGAGTVNYNNCHFYGAGKFLNLYQEADLAHTVNVTGCDFHSTKSNKAALNVKATCGNTPLNYTVTISDSKTDSNFPTAGTRRTGDDGDLYVIDPLVQVDDIKANVNSQITVTLNNAQVYPEAAKAYVAQIGDTEYETLAEAVEAAQNGDTVKLLTNTSGAGIDFAAGKNVVIDFKGYTYTITDPAVGSEGTKNQGIRTLLGSTLTLKNGMLKFDANATQFLMAVHNYGTLTLDNFDIDTTDNSGIWCALDTDCGELTLTGDSDIKVQAGGYAVVVDYWETTNYHGVKAVFDKNYTGTVNGTLVVGSENQVLSTANKDKCVVEIAGGTFNTGAIIHYPPALKGYNPNWGPAKTVESVNITITGGKFSSDPSAYVASGYEVVTNADSDSSDYPYKVQSKLTKVAKIGGKSYATLADAIAAAQSGDTVTLLANCETDATTTVAEGKTVTLDFNGYVLTKNNTGYALENNGTMTLIDSSTGGTGGITSYDGSVENNGTMTIGTGTFVESTKTTSDTQFGGKFTMTGNVRRSKDVYNTENGVMYVYDCTVDSSVFGFYNSGTATVYGGTYVGHSDSTVTKATDNESLYAYTMTSDGTMTVYGAIVTGIHGALGINKGETTVYGGTFKAVKNDTKTSSQASGTYYALYIAGERGTTQGIIYGGTFESEGNSRVICIGNDSDGGLKLPASAQIRGGTFTKSNVVGYGILYAASNTGNPTIYDGTFVGFSEEQATAFKTYVDNNGYMALGYELKAGDNSYTWTVGKKTVEALAVTQKENSSAEGAESNLSSTGDAVVITEATTTTPKTATITPVTVSEGVTETNAGKVTEINQDKLTEYAVANGIEKVEIITGLSATASVGADAAPQTIIKDNDGKTIFEAVARGGGLRFDNKVNSSGQTYGKSGDGASKTNAIDYVDLRLQYEFKLPDGVDVAADSTSWYWTFKYVDNNKVEQSATVNGTNYLPVANKTNTYTSNVLVLNVPLAHIADDFKAMLTITYVLDGVTYTVSQSESTPLARVITDLARSYSGTELTQMGTAATNYITALKNVITAYMNEKSGNSGWTFTH